MKTSKLSAALTMALCVIAVSCRVNAQERQDSDELPVVYESDFSNGASDWRMLDPESWRVQGEGDDAVLSLFQKQSSYKPPHRSPLHIALLEEPAVTDFDLKLRILSTHEDYGHRDACLFFGYQGPDKFYYVHFGKKTDDHANQIFIVNQAARTKISTKTTEGTDWDEKWHDVRLTRNSESGEIKVYFDDMKEPVMVATDKTFTWGKVGVGSFDDTADFKEIVLKGNKK